MQATSTPTLAQPKSSAFAALGGAAVLAAAIGVGALIGANSSTIAAPTDGNDSNLAAYALGVQRNGEIGALTPAQRGLALQRQGEIGLGATTPTRVAPVEIMPKGELFTTPTGTTIFRIGGRDPQASFNQNSGYVSDHDLIRGSLGWYASAPVVDPANESPASAQAAADGWLATQLHGDDLYPAVPFVFERSVNSYPKPMYPPAAPAEGNTDSVGVSHR